METDETVHGQIKELESKRKRFWHRKRDNIEADVTDGEDVYSESLC